MIYNIMQVVAIQLILKLKNNRIVEHRLITAEKFMTVSHILTGLPYDGTKIKMHGKCII